MTAHAFGFNGDAIMNDSGENEDVDWGSFDSGSSDSSSSYEEPSQPEYTEPSRHEYSEPSSSESYDSSSSSDNNSGSDSGSGNNSVSSTSNAPANSTPAVVKKANDVTVSVTGGQKFRIVTNAEHTVYQVYHCGISKASFQVKDADGNTVAFSNVTLVQGEDKLWYVNISFAESVDTKDFTVSVTKDDATYLSTELGVSGIKINGTAVLSTVPAAETSYEIKGSEIYLSAEGDSIKGFEIKGDTLIMYDIGGII